MIRPVQFLLLALFIGGFLTRAIPVRAAAGDGNPFVWDRMSQDLDTEFGATNTAFTFWVTNTSPAEQTIYTAYTSCGCTTAHLPAKPWDFKPGASGAMTVTMDLANKVGLVSKTVTVQSTGGQQTLSVRVDIPWVEDPKKQKVESRERNQMASLSDRQAIFRNDCAKCHVEPTLGRTGEKLFITACGICHTAEHRAAMVPDLSAIKTDTNADYWRTWTTFGKPGTLMAAFSKKHGGILDDAQIDSLVEYLVKAYPSKVAPTAKSADK